MPYVGSDWVKQGPSEAITYGFNFAPWLPTGESILSAVWNISVVTGIDSNPSSHKVGPVVVVDAEVKQPTTGLLPGVKYLMQALATTSTSDVLELYSHVLCEAPR